MKPPILIPLAACIAVVTALSPLNSRAADPTPTAAPTTQATTPTLSYSVNEVVKLYQGGVGTDVLLSYINNIQAPYHLTADEVIYLHGLGMPSEVVTALLKHPHGEAQTAVATAAPAAQPQTQPAPAADQNTAPPTVTAPLAPSAAAPVVTYAAPPAYYGYGPYYGSYYAPPVSFSFGVPVLGWPFYGHYGHGYYGHGYYGHGYYGHGGHYGGGGHWHH